MATASGPIRSAWKPPAYPTTHLIRRAASWTATSTAVRASNSLYLFADLPFGEQLDELIVDRSARLIPISDLAEADADVVVSSDWDADPLDVFASIRRGLQRDEQSIPDLETASAWRTIEPARMLGLDEVTGTLEP